ncbi:hypothetical protein H2200_011092 [Cladophialophora chaetospira]|uniref:NACHT domain-containing protein n=1 Tax=Cladophialophora chaetospira TaxID=386627 RepID=A0AA38X015_9EURO|nr:hypothetical protein H2200_011092 [Cladophialophora chaetospira]
MAIPVSKVKSLEPWEASKQRFLQTLSREDRAQFNLWLDDKKASEKLKDEIGKLETKNKSLGRLKPFVEGLKGLDSIISPVAGLDAHGIVTLVWGGFKVLMTLADKAIAFFEAIAEFLEDIGHELGLFREYEHLYSKHGSLRFNASLERVYSSYLFFCSSAKTFYESSKWRKFVESTGLSRRKHSSSIDLALAEVKAACARARAEVDLAERQSQAAASEQLMDGVVNLGDGIQYVHLRMDDLQRELIAFEDQVDQKLANVDFREFQKWLQHVDMETPLQDNLDKRDGLPNTCTWVFADDLVKSWASSSPDSVQALWVKADAGFGKTVLASYVISEMRKLYPTGVAHFFCKHDENRSVVHILRSWVWQLTAAHSIGGQSVGSHLAVSPDAVIDFNNAEEPSTVVMCRMLRTLFLQNKPTLLIVDGLDECEIPTEKKKREWDHFFEVLSHLPKRWKLLIISRPHNWYNKLLQDNLTPFLHTKHIQKEDNVDDLHDFAQRQVSTFGEETDWSPKTKTEIFNLMLDKADGNLQWVYLLSVTLRYASEIEVRASLDKPPENLTELYGRALDSLSKQNKGLASKVRLALKWILCAHRPLKSRELATVLSMSPNALEANVFKYIGPLVKIEGDRLRLVHASAKDYLVSSEAKIFDEHSGSIPEQLAAIHALILKKCLDYLSSADREYVHVGSNEDASVQRIRERVENDTLLEYSCNGWMQHFVEAYKAPKVIEDVRPELDAMLKSDSSVIKWLQIFHFLWNVGALSERARQHIGALTYRPKGTINWADWLIENHPDFVRHLGWEDGGRYTRWDRYMHKRHGYSHDHPFSMYQSPKVMPGIHVAAFFGYEGEVKRMIAGGIHVDHQGPHGGTPLHWAAAGGACNSIRALLHLGANKEARYGRHRETPIFRAIRIPNAVAFQPGTFPAARLLFDEGAALEHEPVINGFKVSTALIALVEEGPDGPGAVELARMLCARDPVVGGFYMRLGTISQVAAWHNRQLLLEELLRHPAQQRLLNHQQSGTRLRAVLHDACTQNNPEITKILLQAGADANLRCILNRFTPLHFAVRAGGKPIEILLNHERPADPCVPDEGGHMPVHLAVRDNIKLDFGKFVQKGFPVDQVDGNGDTPLMIALQNSNFAIAKRLLDLGADESQLGPQLRIYLPTEERDQRLLLLRAKHWHPINSLAFLSLFRHLSKKHIPIPIFDRILRFANHTDVLEISRKGRMRVNEHITQRIPYPYLRSPRIPGNALAPVKRIELYVRSSDQGHSNVGLDYSLSKLVTINGADKIVQWQPEEKFGRNLHHMQDHRKVVGKKEAPTRIRKVRPGERVAIFPYANSPAFENVMDRAEIKVHHVTFRSYFTWTEREQIWGKHQDGSQGGVRCKKSKCPRCAAERFLKDRREIEPGEEEIRVGEVPRFVKDFGLVKYDAK